MRRLKLFFACLLMAVLSIGNVWGSTEETITLSNGSFSTDHIDWSGTSCTVSQTKGTSSTAVNSSYISAPRVYKGHVLSFVAKTNYKIDSIKITVSGTYYGNSMTAGTAISSGTVTDNTTAVSRSWTSTSGGTHVIKSVNSSGLSAIYIQNVASSNNVQLRPTSIKVYYTSSSTSPSVVANPTSLNFGSVEQNASVAGKTFSVTGSNLTGAITIATPTGYNVNPTSITPSNGAITATNVTVTPVTTNQGTFNGNVTISGGGLTSNVTVGLTMTVTPPFDGKVLEIKNTDFATSYTNANGDHTLGCVTLNSYQVGNYSSSIQFQKNTGYIYNKTALGEIAKIEITKTGNNNLVVYEGTEENPTTTSITGTADGNVTTYTFSSGKSYFRIFCNNTAASNVTPIKVYYYPTSKAVTLSAGSNGSLTATVDAAAIASGDNVEMCKTVAITATPNTGYKIKSLTVTDEDDDEVEVTNNEFVMPAKAVTIAATFEATKTLTGITITNPATQTTFWQGVPFNYDGLEVTAHFDGAADEVVTPTSVTGSTATAGENITVTVSYTEGTTETAEYTINVKAVPSTAEAPYTVAEARSLYDAYNAASISQPTVYVKGVVTSASMETSTNANAAAYKDKAYNVYVKDAETDGSVTFEFYRMFKDNTSAAFTEGDIVVGDTLIANGTLYKYSSTFEFSAGCYMVERIPYTAPKTSIANTKETAYTIAQALEFAADPITYETTDPVYIKGVVYQFDHYTSTSNIYIRDEEKTPADGKFEFFKCAGLKIGEADPVAFEEDGVVELDTVIGYGVMTYYSKNDIWEFPEVNYVVEHKHYIAPVVSVTGVELNKESTSLEVGETETLVATVAPENATNKAVTWASDDETVATVDENGVVTAVAAGTATITVTTTDGSFTDDCEVTVTAADPTKHVVTFDATVDKGESPLSKSNITFTCSNGVLNNESEYRLYKSSTTTFACSVGNITKIEFTGVSGNPVSGFGDPEEGTLVTDGNDGVWTGNAASVSFVASGAQVRATEIKVTYKEDNRADANLAWDPAEDIEITVGDAFTAPTLVKPNDITIANITITSNNESLATVSEGVVSLVTDATGDATITATFTGDENYKPATVSYNITVNEAGLDNVTFDSSEDHAESGETTITKGGFTLSFTSGSMDGTQAEYRLYKSQTMTLSSTDYLIKKIEFTCTSGNPITGFANAAGLDKDNNEWTGESNTVELTASNAQVRMTKIKVFYVEDTRAAAGLAWDPAQDITLTVGEALSAPALQNPNNIDAAEITIASSKTTVATVSEGVVSLVANATGTTTITATFAGNATYKPATVSYKITVNPAYSIYVSPSLNVNFGSVEQDAEVADKKVTVTFTNVPATTLTLEGAGASAFTISPDAAMTESGDITISASSANVGTFAATLTISDDAGNATSKVVNLSITVNEPSDEETPVSTTSQWVAATEIVDGMTVLITGVKSDVTYAMGASSGNGNNRTSVAGSLSEGIFTPGANTMPFILVSTGAEDTYYIKTTTDKYLYNASTSNNSYLKTKAEQEDASWTITLDNSGNAVITSVENTNRQIMRFNLNGTSNPLFNCYASGQQNIKLYVPYVAPEPEPQYTDIRTGLTAGNYYTLCYPKAMTAIQGGTLWSFAGKDASTAYLVQEEAPFVAGRPYIIYAESDKLEAVLEGDDVAAGNYNGLYGTLEDMDAAALSTAGATHMLKNNELRPIGTNNHLDANRAYIKLADISAPSLAPGRNIRKMPLQQEVVTGIDALNASEAPVKMMIDGQLFILRGEKMYNANGQLVK